MDAPKGKEAQMRFNIRHSRGSDNFNFSIANLFKIEKFKNYFIEKLMEKIVKQAVDSMQITFDDKVDGDALIIFEETRKGLESGNSNKTQKGK